MVSRFRNNGQNNDRNVIFDIREKDSLKKIVIK